MRLPIAVLSLAVALVAFACEPPEFSAPNDIADLRILAVRADPADARPGDQVTITGLAADADGSPYDGVWGFVVLSGLEFGIETDPEDLDFGAISPDQAGFQLPGGEPFVYTVPDAETIEETFGYYEKRGTRLTIGALIVGGSETVDDLLSGGGEQRFALKTFIVSERPEDERNENPVFDEVIVETDREDVVLEEDGVYVVPPGVDLRLIARFDNLKGEFITYSWYSPEDPTGGLGELSLDKVVQWTGRDFGTGWVYVVCRNNHTFEVPGGFRTRSTGLDFGYLEFRVRE